MANPLDFFYRGMGAVAGSTGSYGGVLSDEERKAADRQASMMLAASLLESAGPSDRRTSLTQALGRGMLAAQQGRQGSVDQSMQAALLRKQLQTATSNQFGSVPIDKFEPASIEKYKKTGNYEDLVPIQDMKEHADVARFKYFKSLPKEDQEMFLLTQRSPVLPSVETIAGVPSLVDRTAKDPRQAVTPLSSQDAEIAAIIRKALEESRAKGKGSAIGEAEGGIEKKAYSARNVMEKLDLAEPLIDAATGSIAGAGVDKLASAFGASLNGDKAIAQLKVLQADLMTSMPRMEGPQSDRDVQLYREAAGELGDPTVPRGRKLAAVQMIRALQQKYADAGTTEKTENPLGPVQPKSTAKSGGWQIKEIK
jgi:hypothetical protein